jgi:hypothetical protein
LNNKITCFFHACCRGINKYVRNWEYLSKYSFATFYGWSEVINLIALFRKEYKN